MFWKWMLMPNCEYNKCIIGNFILINMHLILQYVLTIDLMGGITSCRFIQPYKDFCPAFTQLPFLVLISFPFISIFQRLVKCLPYFEYNLQIWMVIISEMFTHRIQNRNPPKLTPYNKLFLQS